MPIFPARKTDIDALATAIAAGIAANPADYPSGPGQPFNTATLTSRIASKNAAVNTRQNAEGQFRVAVDAENDAYDLLDDEMIRLLRLAEATHGRTNPDKLTLIGWGPPGDPTSRPPGQVRNLEAVVQGPGNVFLDWKAPLGGTGGRVRFYRIERRIKTLAGQVTEEWGVWQVTEVFSEKILPDQPRGVEIDYRVFAVNSNGDGVPSNTVTVVL